MILGNKVINHPLIILRGKYKQNLDFKKIYGKLVCILKC